MQVDQVVART